MGIKRPKISMLEIAATVAVATLAAALIAPNFVRAKHRVGPDQICRMNLRRIDSHLFEYKEKYGQYPETLAPIYKQYGSEIQGCLEVMPDPLFGVNEERYEADTYSPGYTRKPMSFWSCPLSGAHQTERLDQECETRVMEALDCQPEVNPDCPQTGNALSVVKEDDGFELWCPAKHQGGVYFGMSSVSGEVMSGTRPRVGSSQR